MKKSILIFIGSLLVLAGALYADLEQKPDRLLLEDGWPLETLRDVLIPGTDFHPYPTISRPDGLQNIPQNVRDAHIAQGEKLLDAEWPPLPASVFLDYVRNGNRSRFQSLSFDRRSQLAQLVLAELFERKGRFLDQIINGVWAICEESFWGVPAHLGGQKAGHGLPDVTDPYVDLFAAETASLLAWVHYLLAPQFDEVNPLIAQRIELEIDRRILTPYMQHDDWGWMGIPYRNRIGYQRPVNNWNPWINSNVLDCALLIEKDEARRQEIVFKSMQSVDNFIEPYPADGGCDEGPSYWNRAGGALFDYLSLLRLASDGQIDVFDQPLIKEMGRYIYRVSISDPWFLNFADASAKMHINADIVYRYGVAIGDETMIKFAAFTAQKENYGQGALHGSYGGLNRLLPALFNLKELLNAPAAEPFVRDVWFPDLQVMIARSEESSKGFYLAAKGGHNDESHNHNDIGNFIIYYNGQPVLIDAGSQTYTRQTFSSRRYELWNNQSAYHNLPTINGVMQHAGRQFAARNVSYAADDEQAQFALDIAEAYPKGAQVGFWKRVITLKRSKNIELAEHYKLDKYLRPFTLSFMTPLDPDLSKPGNIALPLSDVTLHLKYDDSTFSATVETIEINDSRMSRNWGHELKRILLTSKQDGLTGKYNIEMTAQ